MSEVQTKSVTSRGTVTIDVEHCKGCDLCIPVCPPKVLSMSTATNHMGYRYPELHPGCTGCAACLLVCPDFVFEVFRFDTPAESRRSRHDRDAAAIDRHDAGADGRQRGTARAPRSRAAAASSRATR